MILNNYFDTDRVSFPYDYDIMGSILSVKINTYGLPPDEVGQSCLFSRGAKPRYPTCTVSRCCGVRRLVAVLRSSQCVRFQGLMLWQNQNYSTDEWATSIPPPAYFFVRAEKFKHLQSQLEPPMSDIFAYTCPSGVSIFFLPKFGFFFYIGHRQFSF